MCPVARGGVMTRSLNEAHEATATLTSLLQTQELVRRIVARLLHVDVMAVDAAIDAGLAELGEHLRVDRAYVFVINGSTMRNTHEWCASGIRPEIENLQALPNSAFSFWMDELGQGNAVLISDVAALPDHRESEREILAAQDILSLVVVPMFSLGVLVGFVGFDAVRTHRTFNTGEVNLLRSMADGVTAVLVSRKAEANALRSEAKLAALTRHASDYVIVFGERGVPDYVSPSLHRFGVEQVVAEHGWQALLHPDDRPNVQSRIDELLRNKPGGVARLPDCRLQNAQQGWRWIAGTLSDFRADPAIRGLLLNAHDITERKIIEGRLVEQTLQDPLTELGNRLLLADRLGHACDRIQVNGGTLAVFFLDIDGFKLVNDGLGHRAGDELLVSIAERLKAFAGPSDTVARFGGDEFVYVSESLQSADHMDAMAQRLLTELKKPIPLGGQSFQITASIGLVWVAGEDGPVDAERLLADADTAMYEAKRDGRNRVARFDPAQRQRVIRATTVQQRLVQAVRNGELAIHYQPLVELQGGRTVGVEALLRWDDPTLGSVSPEEFIPMAEESGLIGELTDYAVDLCLADLPTLPDSLYLSLNLSAPAVPRPETSQWLIDRIERAGVAPERICVEVTETAVMQHAAAAASTLWKLRACGIRTALDDFGTGASSLAVLRELPVDVLKIDRSFVSGIASDPRDLSLIRAVIGLAADFGMQVLAEGVETDAQRQLLLEQGCRLGQGFLFSPALPLGEIVNKLSD